jgi:hypothetical protein
LLAAVARALPPEPPFRRIEVLIAAEPAEREALVRVLLELMQRLSVELEVEPIERIELAAVVAPIAPGSPYLARCFIDLRSAGHATLYVHDPARDRILQRRAPRAAGGEELTREQLGHMLLASIEALLAGATLGAPRSEVVQNMPAPRTQRAAAVAAAPEPARAGWELRAALLYELAVLGHEPGIAHGPALAGLIRTPLSPQLGVVLSAQYRWPIEVGADPVGMRLHAFALRALATLDAPVSARIKLRLGLGGGADLARIAPQNAEEEAFELTDERTLTLAVTRAQLGVELRVSRLLALWAALAADVDLDRSQYLVVANDGGEREVAAPWRVRPALSLGVVLP